MPEQLQSILVIFGGALAAAWLLRFAHAPPIIGYLCAGIAIGPSGLSLLHTGGGHDPLHFFAELGLVLLLFTVGLELSPEPLMRSGRRLLLATGLQTGVTALAAAAIASVSLAGGAGAALLLGAAVALSSTAIVLKQLSDRGETDSAGGVLVTGVLLLQDVFVIVLLILLPMFADAATMPWGHALGKAGLALLALVGVTIAARYAIPRLVDAIFRTGGRDLMTLFAVVMACAGAYLAALAEWSMALGACIAGLALAQCDLRHQLRAEITPFRDVFNALFFVSIGALLELRLVLAQPLLMLAAVAAVLLGKTLITALAVVVAGWPLRLAVAAGLGLCTISEFGYVLVKEAAAAGLLPPDALGPFVAVAVGTMLIGALFVPVADPLSAWIAARVSRGAAPGRGGSAAIAAGVSKGGGAPGGAAAPAATGGHGYDGPQNHVVIVGHGVNGANLVRVLRQTSIPFVVVEMNRAIAARLRAEGVRVVVGDATRAAILDNTGLAVARALVVAIAEVDATRRIVAAAHHARPDLYILARTRFVRELDTLYALGARQVVPEEFETSIEIFAHVLKEFAVPDNIVDQQIRLVRAGRYGMLRGRAADRTLRTEWLAMMEAVLTQTFLVQADSPAAGRTIRTLRFRATTGVTIVAITRRGTPAPSPSPDTVIEVGDVLVLVGSHRQLDAARQLLTGGEGPPG